MRKSMNPSLNKIITMLTRRAPEISGVFRVFINIEAT